MARIAGKDGRLYVGLASDTAAAEPVTFLNSWDISFTADRFEVTSFGDTTKTYVQGLSDASGNFAGFYDSATAQLYTAANDGAARRVYLYPDATVGTAGPYWFGTAFVDFSVSTPVGGSVDVSGSFAAATSFSKIG